MSLLGKVILQGKKDNKKQHLLCMEDLKLALMLGDGYLGQTPLIAGGIWASRCLDTVGIEDLYEHEDSRMVNGTTTNGVGGEVWNIDLGGDAMQIDGDDGWQGGDADGLDGVLDDVLNLADL
jgi:transcriptional coactivator HFI1/ADA1